MTVTWKCEPLCGDDTFRLSMSIPDYRDVAWVEFVQNTVDDDPYIEVCYLKSHREGSGYGRAVMEELYSRYPDAHIDWGETIHSASKHLAEDFEDRYFSRTSYIEEVV